MTSAIRRLRRIFRPNVAWCALFAALALSGIGITAIAGSSQPGSAVDQGRWLIIALSAMVVAAIPTPKTVSLAAGPLLIGSLGLLVLLIVPGLPDWLVYPRNGARCWINLYFMDFQPSEIVKILFVIALARHMRYRENYLTLTALLVPFTIMFVPVVLINMQPDLGTAILFVPALFVVLLMAGARMRHVWVLVGLGLAALLVNLAVIAFDPPHERTAGGAQGRLPGFVHLLEIYQERRIASMLWPELYKHNVGRQQAVAMNVAGAGQLTGYGFDDSATLARFSGLTFDHTDMIYAVVVNRWGLLGGLVVLGLYLLLTLSWLIVATKSKDPFARLATVGFVGILGSQAVINIGMTVGLLPIIGITLPFVSYGGSSLVASFIMVGLVLNFARRPRAMLARPSFEFDNHEAMFQ